jgi:molybdate transport system permease protein
MTLRCIAGLETPEAGRVIINDKILFDSEKGINLPCQMRNIGLLFQNYALFPHMTAFENIAFALKKTDKKIAFKKIKDIISMVQLDGFEDKYPYQISGGQQQRVALARAFAMEPDILLFDEPFSALDNHLRNQMEMLMLQLLEKHSGPVIFVSHNLKEIFRMSKNLIILDNGRMISFGTKNNLFKNPTTYIAARLTGCKNLSIAAAIDNNHIKALDWDCNLLVDQKIPPNLSHVGIRSQYITFTDSPGSVNNFPCSVIKTIENPDNINLYLRLEESKSKDTVNDLQCEIPKEYWEKLKKNIKHLRVYLDPRYLFLTTG